MTSSKMIKSLEDFEPCQYSATIGPIPAVRLPSTKYKSFRPYFEHFQCLQFDRQTSWQSCLSRQLGERGSKGRGRLRKNSRPQKKSNRSRAVIAQSSADSVSAQSPDGRRFYIELAATVREIRTPSEKVIQAH